MVVTPHNRERTLCNAVTVARSEMVREYVNVVVLFSPEVSCLAPNSRVPPPGGSPAEVLFHELVHAFNAVTGTQYSGKLYANPFVPQALKYDNEDDFFAILITNIFSSETNRPLRGGHSKNEPLPLHLSTDDGFLAVEDNVRLIKKFCDDHRTVSSELSKVPSDFNPIRGVLLGKFAKYVPQIMRPPMRAVEELPKSTKSIPGRRP